MENGKTGTVLYRVVVLRFNWSINMYIVISGFILYSA